MVEQTTEEKLENLLFWKMEFKKILKEKDNEHSELTDDEIQKRFLHIEKNLYDAELNMVNTKKGLYFGIGYELNREANPKPVPIYGKWSNLTNHVGFKGTTRVGKTQNMLGHIDQIIELGWDAIVLDPKGGEKQEILSSVAESCYKHNRTNEMTYYSPAFEDLSQKINVLYGKSNLEISSMIVDSIKDSRMESFYLDIATRILLAETTAYEYLQAISDPDGTITRYLEEEEVKKYYEFINNTSNDQKYNLKNKDIIDDFKNEKENSKEFKELSDIGFNRTLLTFRDLERFCSYEGLESLLKLINAIPLNEHLNYSMSKMNKLKSEAVRILTSALRTDVKHFSKVADTLANRLLQLSIGPIGEMLCGTRINPLANRLLRKDKGVVAVIQPFPMKFKNSANMFSKTLLGMLDSMMGTVGAEGRTLPRRVAIFIDEAGTIMYDEIVNFFNRAGGLGITTFVYTQSDEDYIDALGETKANVVMDNVNTKGTLRLNLRKSALEAAEDIGTISVHKTIAMISAGGSDGRYSSDVKEEYLCKPTDIQALPTGEGILIHDGKKYYVEFPYRMKPKGSFKMPELETEKSQRYLIDFERDLEKIKTLEITNANLLSSELTNEEKLEIELANSVSKVLEEV